MASNLSYDGAPKEELKRVVDEVGNVRVKPLKHLELVTSEYDVAPQLRILPRRETFLPLALTSYGQKDGFTARKVSAFDHFILKPVNIDDILASLERVGPVAVEIQW